MEERLERPIVAVRLGAFERALPVGFWADQGMFDVSWRVTSTSGFWVAFDDEESVGE